MAPLEPPTEATAEERAEWESDERYLDVVRDADE